MSVSLGKAIGRFSAAMALLIATTSLGCDGDGRKNADSGPQEEVCGNGKLDSGERCDSAIPEGHEGSCPTECAAADPCEVQVLEGADCQAHCVGSRITSTVSGDGCCPRGGTAIADSDCGVCGDGILGPGETCEGSCPTPEKCVASSACLTAQFSGSAKNCTAACNFSLVTVCAPNDGCCPPGCTIQTDSDCSPSCGDGIVQPDQGETCEPGSASAPCPDSCDDGNPCTQDIRTGAPELCNVQCSLVPIPRNDSDAGTDCAASQ